MKNNKTDPEHESSSSLPGMESSAEFLEAIKQATLQVSSSLNQEDVLCNILKSCFELINGIKDARILLMEDDKIVSCAGLNNEGKLQIITPGENQYGWIKQLGQQPKLLTEEDASATSICDSLPMEWTGPVIAWPFQIQEAVRGALVLAYEQKQPLSKREKFIITLLKDQAAIALHNALLHRMVEEQALTDVLTGLPNRRSLDLQLQKELDRAAQYQYPVAVLLLDIDRFKQINDRYGHLSGDLLLKQVARLLTRVVRKTDFIARYGGDEFAIILPQTSRFSAALTAARLEREFKNTLFDESDEIYKNLGVSIGLATYPENGDSLLKLIEKADRELYNQKNPRP